MPELFDIRVFAPREGPHSTARFGILTLVCMAIGAGVGEILEGSFGLKSAGDSGFLVGLVTGLTYTSISLVYTLGAVVRDWLRDRRR